jgi:mono/diheme cytochrome c family protein
VSVTAAIHLSLVLALIVPAVLAAGEQTQRWAFSGKALFSTYCATCHGPAGKGDGPFAKSLRKPPSDLTLLAQRNKGMFPAERVAKIIDGRDTAVSHGNADMPVWGDAFSRTTEDSDPESVQLKIQALVQFLDSLQERPAAQ